MATRSERRFARTGDSLPRWHRKLERRFGIIFGYYHVERPLRLGPFGLVFIGPMGPNVSQYRESRKAAWRGARGFEVCFLGHSLYVEKDVV